MSDSNWLAAGSVSAELAAALPRFDPDRPIREDRSRWVVGVSLLLHVALLLLFWDAILGAVVPEEETVVVSMIEEKKPEEPKPKPKLLAQRTLDTKVRQRKEVVQHEIQVVQPVPVLAQARKVEVDPVKLTEAPKPIVQREIRTRTVDVFGEVVASPQPVEVDRVAPSVRQVRVSKASAGPRKTTAAAPTNVARAAEVVAPTQAEGVISSATVAGSLSGAKVAELESGTSEALARGDGDRGRFAGAERDCSDDPICLAYIEMIRKRVYARWNPGPEAQDGEVRLRFRIDRGGSAHGIRLVRTDDRVLGDTCVTAFRHASPFPPPPREIQYLVNKGLVATFDYEVSEPVRSSGP